MTNKDKRDLIAKRLRFHREMLSVISGELNLCELPQDMVAYNSLSTGLNVNKEALRHFIKLAKEAPPKDVTN